MTVTYPDTALAFRVRLALGADLSALPSSWVWTEITDDVSFRRDRMFTVMCGAQDEQQESDSELELTVRNHESAYFAGPGRYTTDNPNSDLWPYFDLGCPVELAVDPGDGVWHVLSISYLAEATNDWPGGSGQLALTTVGWSGLMRRIARRSKVKSQLYRSLTSVADPVLHYWPVEQADRGAALTGVFAPSPVHASTTSPIAATPVLPGTEFGPPGSLPLPLWTNNSQVRGRLTDNGVVGPNGPTFAFGLVFRAVPAQTAGACVPYLQLQLFASGGDFKAGKDSNGNQTPSYLVTLSDRFVDGVRSPGFSFMKIQAFNNGAADGTLNQTVAIGDGVFDGLWHCLFVHGYDSSGTINLEIGLDTVPFVVDGLVGWTFAYECFVSKSANMGKPNSWTWGAGSPVTVPTVGGTQGDNVASQLQWSAGHFHYQDETTGAGSLRITDIFRTEGETTIQRWVRVCGEEGIPANTGHTEVNLFGVGAHMGPQMPGTIVDVLREIERTDRGVLVDRLGVMTLVSSTFMTNRASSLTITGAATEGPQGNRGQLPRDVTSTSDDQHVINSVTVDQANGVPFTVSDPASIARSGTYEGDLNVSSWTDGTARGQAGWSVRTGIERGARYAQLSINLRMHPELIAAVLALIESKPDVDPGNQSGLAATSGVGCRLTLTELPRGSAPGDVDLQIRGWSMTITGRRAGWVITFNLVPYWPYEVYAIENDGGTGVGDGASHNRSRLASGRDSSGAARSRLSVAVDTDDTTLQVLHPSGGFTWDSTASGFDALVDGEPVTVSAIGSSLKDSFNGRTVPIGWSTPSTAGGAYTALGTAADMFVSSGRGGIQPSAAGSTRAQWLATAAAEGIMVAHVRLHTLPATTGGVSMGVLLRGTTGGEFVGAVLKVGVGSVSATNARIFTRIGGVTTDRAVVALPWTYVADTWYVVMGGIWDNTVYLRIWPRDDAAGAAVHRWPSWQATFTGIDALVAKDASHLQFGAVAREDDGASGKLIEYDSLELITPQPFTVVRSITDVVRSHAVGADVDLWHPPAISLAGRAYT